MRRRMVLLLGGALVLFAAAVGWWQSRPRLTDEEQILAVIAEVRAAAEERNAGGVLRHIDDDYDDGTYKKLVISDGRLAGAVLIGDVGDALWYLELIRTRRPTQRIRADMMFGRSLAARSEAA